jgi:serine protease Do
MEASMAKMFSNAGRTLTASLLCAIVLGAGVWAVATRGASLQSVWPDRAILHRAAATNLADFADVVDAVKPAVFAVKSKVPDDTADDTDDTSDRNAETSPPAAEKRPSSRFALPDEAPGEPLTRKLVTSQGSGFFVSRDGYAVTNSHVVANADSTEITTEDHKVYSARVIGSDPLSDLALLKVDGRDDFQFVTLADQAPRVGSWVLAFGNPFGLGGTVTAGIVSARERNFGMRAYQDLIQIDAPINKGDSGGPSFNLDGKVVGVNTMIISPTGGSVGIAFAIPAETVKFVVPQLKDKGAVTRGWLGVRMQPVTADVAESLQLKDIRGALVVQLDAGSPAANAGIATGDIITSVNGDPIKQIADLGRKVSTSVPRTALSLSLVRRGEQKTVAVTLGQLPPQKAPDTMPSPQ